MDTFQTQGVTMNVLFVCADNARHSLIAESLLRSRRKPGLRAFSAGIAPADLPPPPRRSARHNAVAGGRTKTYVVASRLWKLGGLFPYGGLSVTHEAGRVSKRMGRTQC